MFLTANGKIQEENMDEPIDLIIAKNRNGERGAINLMFQKQYMRFVEQDQNDVANQVAKNKTTNLW